MVNFYPTYVSEQLRQWSAARIGEDARQKTLHPDRPDLVKSAMATWSAANPKPTATLADVANHIDHIAKRIGTDHIGVGSDFDGGSVGLAGLEDVSAYPALFTELARRGYSFDDLRKIASGNTLRVLRAAETYAAAHKGDAPIESPTSF